MSLTEEFAAITIEPSPQKVANEAPKKGKAKVRKGQSPEEYERQVEQYQTGPPIETQESILERDYSKIDGMSRLDRHAVRHAAERAYYLRQYDVAVKVVDDSQLLESAELQKKHARDMNEIRQVYDASKALL